MQYIIVINQNIFIHYNNILKYSRLCKIKNKKYERDVIMKQTQNIRTIVTIGYILLSSHYY